MLQIIQFKANPKGWGKDKRYESGLLGSFPFASSAEVHVIGNVNRFCLLTVLEGQHARFLLFS